MYLNPVLKKDYTKFIEEYVSLGHGSYVPLTATISIDNRMVNKYCVPHHAVIRREK